MRRAIAVLVVVVLFAPASAPPVSAQSQGPGAVLNETGERDATGTGSDVLVVDDDGDAAYTSIQAAVDDASAGDTVRVRPGTYREQVSVGANVTVVAPDGATLNGSAFDGLSHGFRIESGVVPVVEGFTIREYAYGVNAERPPRMGVTESGWETGWTVRNVTFVGCREDAIRAGNSMADWTVANVQVDGRDGFQGISTFGSLGDWTIRNTVVRNVGFDAVDADGRGDWTIRNVSISGAGDGIDLGDHSGNATIRDTTVRNVSTGIALDGTEGTVTIERTVIRNVTHPADDPRFNGLAVYAADTTGDWRIRDSVLRGYSRHGINATGASPSGDATGNWWGPDGPAADACIGNVRCGGELASRPDAGASLDDPGAPASVEPAETPSGTPTATSGATPIPDGRTATATSTATSGTPTPSVATTVPDSRTPATSTTDSGLPAPVVVGAVVVLVLVVGVLLSRVVGPDARSRRE